MSEPRTEADERYLRLREVSELLDMPAWHDDARINKLGVDEVQGARWLASWIGVQIAGLDWIMPATYEREAASPAALDVERLARAIEQHQRYGRMGYPHACKGDCAEDIAARLTQQDGTE